MKRLNLILMIVGGFLCVSNAFSQSTEGPRYGVDLGFGEELEKRKSQNLNKSVGDPNLVYFDENYKPANSGKYTYRRIIKYKEPVIYGSLNSVTDLSGRTTVAPVASQTGTHICSLTDYYKTGEPALAASLITVYPNCSHGYLHGVAVFYYKNGRNSSKWSYNVGKLQGTVIFYNEDGTEREREEYENGKLIEANKFSVPVDNPLIGTWRYVEYYASPTVIPELNLNIPGSVKYSVTVTYYQNSIVETLTEGVTSGKTNEKRNWKYVSPSNVEHYQGDDLLERGTIRWISRNQYEYTITFHQNPNIIGQKYTYVRQ